MKLTAIIIILTCFSWLAWGQDTTTTSINRLTTDLSRAQAQVNFLKSIKLQWQTSADTVSVILTDAPFVATATSVIKFKTSADFRNAVQAGIDLWQSVARAKKDTINDLTK